MKGKTITIKNEFSKRALYKYSVLEGKVEGNTLVLSYSKPIFDERGTTLSSCHHEIEIGVIYSGFAKHNPEWVGDATILNKVKYIEAPYIDSFDVRKALFHNRGFKWNREIKKWEKQN